MNEEPLIFTTKGNVPVKDLEYETRWEQTDEYIKFNEIYKLNGEVVKQSAHVMLKKGLTLEGKQGELS